MILRLLIKIPLLLLLSCSNTNDKGMNKIQLFSCDFSRVQVSDPFSERKAQEREEQWDIEQSVNVDKIAFLKSFKEIPVAKEQTLPFAGFAERFIFFDGEKYWLISFLLEDLGVIVAELEFSERGFGLSPRGIRKEGSEQLSKALRKCIVVDFEKESNLNRE
jgi:hypothetical protein